MKNEVERLLNGRGLEVNKKNKTLTENLRQWRADRNITKADYLTFVGNVLEELLEPLYTKKSIENIKDDFISTWIDKDDCSDYSDLKFLNDVVNAIQNIQVFCINETELMGFDNIKCNKEVFSEINSREQDPEQKEEWLKNGAVGKWQKNKRQESWTLYKANYESCKL